MPVQLTLCEQKYYQMLRSGHLLTTWPFLTGFISEDWEKWIVIYESLK